MRYVPNLIPDKFKVLKDYFKEDKNRARKPNPLLIVSGWIFGMIFFIATIVCIPYTLLTLIFGIIAFILIPPGHYFIERILRFRFTTKIKSIVVAVLIIGAIPLASHYSEIITHETAQLKLKAEQQERKKAEAKREAERLEKNRKDSLNFYIESSNKLEKENKIAEASRQLDYALGFVSTQSDKDLIANKHRTLSLLKTSALMKAAKYQAALPELNSLIAEGGDNADILYSRAICYSKTGKTQEAVDDCKEAVRLGNINAEKLYNKINPLRKRVLYYLTRCCDGTASPTNAKGRGACSWHGGVCNRNEPVYEEYRK